MLDNKESNKKVIDINKVENIEDLRKKIAEHIKLKEKSLNECSYDVISYTDTELRFYSKLKGDKSNTATDK